MQKSCDTFLCDSLLFSLKTFLFRFSPKLEPDPSFISGMVMSLCALPLWQFNYPNVNKYLYQIVFLNKADIYNFRRWYKELSYTIYGLMLIGLIYGTLSLFRLNYILLLTVVIITCHQLLAPNKDNVTKLNNGDDPSYENVKAKLE